MVNDRKIAVRLRDCGMPCGIGLATNRKRTLMHLLRFLQAAFAGVEDPKIIQDGGDIRVLGSEMFFIELERVQVTRLGRFLPSTPTVNESDIVEHRPQIGVAHVSEQAPGLDGCLVVSDRFLFLSAHIAKVSQPARQPIDRLLIGRLNRVDGPQRSFQQYSRFGVIPLLIVNQAQPFIAQSKRGMVSGKNPLLPSRALFRRRATLRAGDPQREASPACPARFAKVSLRLSRLPAFAELANKVGCQCLSRQWKRLFFVRGDVGTDKETGRANHFPWWGQNLAAAAAGDERIANPHRKTEFRRREHVPSQQNAPGRG